MSARRSWLLDRNDWHEAAGWTPLPEPAELDAAGTATTQAIASAVIGIRGLRRFDAKHDTPVI